MRSHPPATAAANTAQAILSKQKANLSKANKRRSRIEGSSGRGSGETKFADGEQMDRFRFTAGTFISRSRMMWH